MSEELPLAPFDRIAKNAGANRVSSSAIEELRDFTEEKAEDLAKDAVTFCKHAKRKTVKVEDIEMIKRMLEKE